MFQILLNNEARTNEAILYYGMPGKMVLLNLSLVFWNAAS